MVDHNDDPKPRAVRRIEGITDGGARRRRWSDQEKASIVAESFAPGAVVAEVARRHDARAQQVHGWRRDAREGRLVLPAEQRSQDLVSFAPVIVAPLEQHPPAKPAARPSRPSRPAAPMIEIEAKGVVVRVRDGAGVLLVEAMLRVLRARA
jgi:transposase